MSSGSAPTSYTYTGQYSNVSDFGLMFYNARWYDPVLGRMAQADSIVPGGVQGYDRYAYANNSPLVFTDPTGHFGNHNDEKSDYWNRRNQQKVTALEEKWRVEEEEAKAFVLLQSLFRQTWKEITLDPALAVSAAFSGRGKVALSMLVDPPPPPHNDQNPYIIRLPGVWQPGDSQLLDPLGKGAVLAFGAIALGELYAIGGETAGMVIGIPILAVAVWGTMSWWNVAQTPTT